MSNNTKPKHRNLEHLVHVRRGGAGAGKHHNRTRDVATGRSRKAKHKRPEREED